MDVCRCRDHDVAVFGGENFFSLLRVLIYILVANPCDAAI
jgi:hypothetical protein